MIIKNLTLIQEGKSKRITQDSSKFIENWTKRTPDDGKINWKDSTKKIHTLIRATTHPYPGAFTLFNGKKLKIFKAEFSNKKILEHGKIIQIKNDGVDISTGDGIITLQSVQLGENDETNPIKIFTKNDIGKFLM